MCWCTTVYLFIFLISGEGDKQEEVQDIEQGEDK